jgi:hypothetical protein
MGIDTDKAEIDNALAWAAKALHRECYGADEGTRREALREALTRTLARTRAEGFRAAKERAAEVCVEFADAYEASPDDYDAGKCAGGNECANRIRAMEDAGEGGAGTGLHCGECSHMRHSGPCPENCACDMAETSGEPPLSQLRAATERMEAATRAEVDGDLKPIRGFAMPPPGVLAAIRTRHANPGDASETSPTPAAMLGEIDDMLTRSRSLVVRLRGRVGDDAGALSLYLRALEDEVSRAQGDAARAKREAEAREGQG